MISSMTGYGRGEFIGETRSFLVEIKSVNHRYNDIIIRMPKKLSAFEERIKKLIKSSVKRGRIEVYITLEEYKDDDLIIKPNLNIIEQYHDSLLQIKDKLNLKDDINLSTLTRFPDIFTIENREEEEEVIWEALKTSVNQAVLGLINMRKVEGVKLAEDIKIRSEKIYNIVEDINLRSPIIIKEYRDKLLERIRELTEDNINIDEDRIALEVSVYADKSNITEEIVRLFSHIEQLKLITNESGAVGRKLDFLIQEMNREINTIGSKSSDIEISKMVIEVKSELEKIREQIQNIE
ncbi:YicC/YloC family endoribonuclease [Maledivibacter halophilus]|uniref:TIGR00255 family protein n=1 Tax=Maledivibacter halophilus TaxID=36842 RepID=A0A1T5MGG3_9FIRM|nr:YicC/YloC family endoribonuclease [Maledivibacter halophilus]SKC87265.1 TIGR00255 family protein [Maledivibacter halophilus]